jgi:hypothetical protein
MGIHITQIYDRYLGFYRYLTHRFNSPVVHNCNGYGLEFIICSNLQVQIWITHRSTHSQP